MSDAPYGDAAFMLGLMVGLPFIIAKFVVGATLVQVLLAFPLFWAITFLGLGFGNVNQEVFGWTLIAQIFVAWVGVPICAGLLKWLEIPQRWL
ncbi:hypothetical protein [uncultured Erythrobacter sp.]|uniref:hypothetical protein n=1 Tax=uncultured Erythrobacter sp. TaxID=263913 RepID=UPI002608F2C9|nr:hypothetical protein [uncultured Erythrobacter sp.]